MKSNKAFDVFDTWLSKRGHGKFVKKEKRKELWKLFVAEVKQCGIIDVFKCSDYNLLCKLLSLPYQDEEGYTIDGPFKYKEITMEELEKQYEK